MKEEDFKINSNINSPADETTSRKHQAIPKPPKKYEKPVVRLHEALDEITFLTGGGATGVGVVVSGGGL